MILSAISVNQMFSTVAYALECKCDLDVNLKSGGSETHGLVFSSPKLTSCSKLNGTKIALTAGSGTLRDCRKTFFS